MVAYTVTDKASGEKIGNVAYLNIVPQMRRIEIGSIWCPPFPLNLLFRARCSLQALRAFAHHLHHHPHQFL